MRHFRSSFLILMLASSGSPALAQGLPANNAASQPIPAAAPVAVKPVDTLFEALKRERDPTKARGIASQIFSDLNDSGSATVNLLMQWATTAMKEKRNAAALDFLDQVTVLDPGYPEGWNRRATLHYTMGETRKSMADIAEVLRREPRHLGALAGMAGILIEAGKDELALKAWERYLDVYPADRDAQEAVAKLSEKIAGNRT
jgi:tetratricopeptide (TPR) repeat protein